MNPNKLKFYTILSTIPILKKHFVLKITFVAFLGLLSPLLVFAISLALTGTSHYSFEGVTFFLIICLIFIIGIAIMLPLWIALLSPITLISEALQHFFNEKQVSQLPIDFEDTIGQLMANVQYSIEQMDIMRHARDHTSNKDNLTGLLNQQAGQEYLFRDLARSHRENVHILIALIDIDNFKSINERFGYHVGDVCLAHIAEAMSNNIREGDWIARWGEDEFLIVLWNFNHESSIVVLQRIQQYSIKTPMGGLLEITLSIGAYEYKGEMLNSEILLTQLRKALQEAKRAGCGNIRFKD